MNSAEHQKQTCVKTHAKQNLEVTNLTGAEDRGRTPAARTAAAHRRARDRRRQRNQARGLAGGKVREREREKMGLGLVRFGWFSWSNRLVWLGLVQLNLNQLDPNKLQIEPKHEPEQLLTGENRRTARQPLEHLETNRNPNITTLIIN